MTIYKQLQDSWIRSEWVDSNVEEFGENELLIIPNTVSFGSVTLPDLITKNITKTNYHDIIKIANYIMVDNVDPIVDKIVEIFDNVDVVYEFEEFYRLSERLKPVTKLVEILNLESSHVKLLSELDNDVSIQEQIMALSFLIPDIINSFKKDFCNLKTTYPTGLKRPWLLIIKTLLKNSYQLIVDDYLIKVNNIYVHTQKYTFINKNVLYQKKI